MNIIYVAKQLKYLLFGCALAYFISLIDYTYIKKFADLFMGVTLVLLVIVLFLPETESVGGAVRWISIGGIVIQPSEIAKICVIIFILPILINSWTRSKSPRPFLSCVC
jgi:cell division protein FtsW